MFLSWLSSSNAVPVIWFANVNQSVSAKSNSACVARNTIITTDVETRRRHKVYFDVRTYSERYLVTHSQQLMVQICPFCADVLRRISVVHLSIHNVSDVHLG